MKILFALLLGAVVSLPASAMKVAEKEEVCEAISSLAGVIMQVRQSGRVTVVDVINKLDSFDAPNEAYRNYVKGIVVDAYETPLFVTDKVKADVINEFSNEYFINCLKMGG